MFKAIRAKRAKHIADVYQNELDPEGYLKMERDIRKNNIIEAVSLVFLIALGILSVKVWFILEGFTIQW